MCPKEWFSLPSQSERSACSSEPWMQVFPSPGSQALRSMGGPSHCGWLWRLASLAYALAVTCREQGEVQGVRKRVDQLAHARARGDWQVLNAGAGSKGSRLFAWARIELAAPETSGWQRWLLVRRNLEEGVKPAEMASILVFAPTGTSLEEMVEAFGARWTVEQCFEEAKGEVGLDEYEVRTFHGWFRHVTLSMLAMTFLMALRVTEEAILKKSLSRHSRPPSQKPPALSKSTHLLIFQ